MSGYEEINIVIQTLYGYQDTLDKVVFASSFLVVASVLLSFIEFDLLYISMQTLQLVLVVAFFSIVCLNLGFRLCVRLVKREIGK
jgi:hypothetical protein